MSNQNMTYTFGASVEMRQVADTLAIAVMAVEALHGESRVHLEAEYQLDARRRTCVIEGLTEIAQDLNRVFVGYLRREFGGSAFGVHRHTSGRTQAAV